MDIIEIIKKRKSCRTFSQETLKAADKIILEDYIRANNSSLTNEAVNFVIVEKADEDKKMKLDYGLIRGHNTYVLGKTISSQASRVNYGYLMEKLVLKATEINVSTCWIGYFDIDYFNELSVEDGYEIPGIIIIGYAKDKLSFQAKFARLAVSASKRSTWDKLFFNYKLKTPLAPDNIKSYADSLEMVRLAPSSGNTEPWRIFFEEAGKEFHFFKKAISKRYETKGLHDIDMGIALAHFELTSLYKGLSGSWTDRLKENKPQVEGLQYIMTWKCNNQ
jgi:nitroreductase